MDAFTAIFTPFTASSAAVEAKEAPVDDARGMGSAWSVLNCTIA